MTQARLENKPCREPILLTESELLEAIVKEWIDFRTDGNIHQLQVNVNDNDKVQVCGYASTWLMRPFAYVSLLEVLGKTKLDLVELDIQVVGSNSHRLKC